MASPGNPNNPQQNPQFELQKLFRPSSNHPVMPSSPPPYPTSSCSYPPPTGPLPFHYLPYPPPQPPPQQELHFFQHQLHQPPPPRSPISSYAAPTSPSPDPNSSGARLMALLGTQSPNPNPPDLAPQSAAFAPSPSAPPDFVVHANLNLLAPSAPPSGFAAAQCGTPVRMLSSKLPKGRHLIGDHLVYDIDVRLQGEVQPQLEVTPITKYVSDPGLVLGRQIAVNRNYICYGLKMGNIRVLNINTALRSLLRGHTQRVTDMAFFAEDVHLLASASIDGRIFVWKINEGADEEEKAQISGKIVIAVQIVGEEEPVHPRLCWHPHKQEILMVAIGNRILKIDTTKVGKAESFTAEEPLKCSMDKLMDGIQIVGKHDAVVTDLSMCQWMTSRLASASVDGTVKIWEDRKPLPLAVLRPHDGHAVNSVTFLTAPHRPDHIVLITGGPVNREVKIWTSSLEEGWLLPSDSESWQCTQTLELKGSGELRVEDAFFNQVVALPRAGLLLLANAKKNAIYAVHIDYGPHPAATRMDYVAEFTVTMPILSITGTSESLPDGEHIVQVYCVQTQAIQQYALALSQCLPPPLDNTELEKTESNVSRVFDAANPDGFANLEMSHGTKHSEITSGNATLVPSVLSSSAGSAPGAAPPVRVPSSQITTLPETLSSGLETKLSALPSPRTVEQIHSASPPLPLSPRISRMSSGFRTPVGSFEPGPAFPNHAGDLPVVEYSSDRILETGADGPAPCDDLRKDDKSVVSNDIPMVPDPPMVFKHPTHLVTPSEILSKAPSSSETQISQGMSMGEAKVQDVVVNNDTTSTEVEVKVVGETGIDQNDDYSFHGESQITIAEQKEKSFYSQASDLGIQMARDCRVDNYSTEGAHQTNDVGVSEPPDQFPTNSDEGMTNNAFMKVGESETPAAVPQSLAPTSKGKRQKGKTSLVSGPSSTSPSPFNSTDSSNDPGSSSGVPSADVAFSQFLAMQESLDQLISMQKEMQKQMATVVSVPFNKESRRLETSLGRNMEKVVKANADALWARFQEEHAKHEKLERDRTQQITNLITNSVNKDLPAMLEKTIKKEIAAIGPSVVRAVTPSIEKSISVAITESFQKGVGDKTVSQLEKAVNSKLEAVLGRQIQSQFQTYGKQALQEALRSSLEASIIPAFELSCKSMFEQVDATLQKGFMKHITATQQQLESTHSPLAIALRDAISSASSITQTLSGELIEGQRKLLAIATAGASSNVANPLVTQLSNGPLPGLHDIAEAPIDPTKELSRLIAENKYEEAFTAALHKSDVSIVSWLCSQVDLQKILSISPLPLSQGVLLALLQQLACDMSKETPRKVSWMTEVAVVINPGDPMIAVHVRPIFEQVYQILGHHRNLPTLSASEANSIRLLMHVINSVLTSCK
ncbi:enhancer of mRNA-decapping protein 4-like [Rhodamnia argentea]|uniref:Enhancer of mRNA-decapping protein 4-like n=1 Tax=Rhodamnia argentea TaxID=178133 RepID=A0A8B8QH82_9MYRT|nr:enhancer of mRNA-decapping protein 4-like [Rhodamnia argentea]